MFTVYDLHWHCIPPVTGRVRLLACFHSNTEASVMETLLTLLVLEAGRKQRSCKITS